MRLDDFNALPADAAAALLRPCVGIASWVDGVVAARPYDDRAALVATARRLADAWTDADVEEALADHPRIGERPAEGQAGAHHSAREQAGLDPADRDLAARLRVGNERYEERFGRIYLVRAAGHTGPELLALLEERLGNDPETEAEVTRRQLAEITLLRLEATIG